MRCDGVESFLVNDIHGLVGGVWRYSFLLFSLLMNDIEDYGFDIFYNYNLYSSLTNRRDYNHLRII